MLYRPERGRMWDPSIFPWKGQYWMLAMHYDGPDAPPTGMWLARSADMVHWQGVGRVLEDSAGLFKMYASLDSRGRVFLNYGSTSSGDHTGDNDTIKYCASEDMIHWERLGENHPDPAWYKSTGRWDHMYVLRDGDKWYGYPVATPLPEMRSCMGLQVSGDGANWRCAPPPRVEWGDIPPIDCLETGGVEKIGDEYYYIGGYVGYAGSHSYNVYVFRASNPLGPFRPDREAFRLCGADSVPGQVFVSNLGCFFRDGDELLLSNAVSAPGGDEVWLLPVRRVLRDAEGHLRLAWWEGNRALLGRELRPEYGNLLRGEAVLEESTDGLLAHIDVPDAPTVTDRAALLELCPMMERGLVITGEMTCESAPPYDAVRHRTHCWRPARVGFGMGDTVIALDIGHPYRRRSWVLRAGWEPQFHAEALDEIGGDCASLQGVSAGETHSFRFLARRNMMELYVNERLVQTWSAPTAPLTLYVQNARCRLDHLRFYEMSL